MGDLQAWTTTHAPANGVFWESSAAATMSIHVAEISDESWRRAEEATREVIESIQPTTISEKRRKAVVEYVQKLIRGYLQSDVYPYGSVPLKTYLPDGDIDLKAFGMPNIEDALANDVRSVLEMEVKNKYAEFDVKDVQYIHAEVKLVKCLVQNIVVDISFNQMGGLCTLCFLEQVDRLIGKDHLFKRSIMLIKAWCYYESRILGAHHGLISTYALETLVLYIFHLFHASLDGPLAVLYRFLDYYSKFDWDSYCVSLYGPVSVSSLPELVAEAPESEGGDLLLTKEFLRNCVDSFSVLPRGFESNPPYFPQKHLNIVDPLKESNNLGRSVSRANFYRIRSAFTYGARKLGRILLLPSNCIVDEVNMFFTNTLERHGSGERPDVQDILPKFSGSELTSHNGMDSTPSVLKAIEPDGELCKEINTIKLSGLDDNGNGVESNGLLISRCLVGDATDHATSSTQSREGNKTPLSAYEKTQKSHSLPGTGYFVPQLFSPPENGHENGGPCQKTQANLGMVHSVSLTKSLPSYEESRLMQPDFFESESSPGRTSLLNNNHGTLASSSKADLLENSYAGDCSFAGGMENGGVGSSRPNKFPDLSGDYELHYKNLVYTQWIQEYASGTLFLQSRHSSSSYQYHNKHSWDPARQRGVYTHMNANGVAPGPPFLPSSSYPIAQPFISGIYGSEDLLKPRGTGTYFPNTNYRSTYKERHYPGSGKTPSFSNHLSRNHNNDRAETPQDTNFQERSTRQPPERSQLPDSNGNNHGMQVLSDVAHSTCPALKETSANTFVFLPEGRLEFGSFGPLPLGAPSAESGKRSESVSPQMPGSGQVVPASTMLRPSSSSIPGRFGQAYQLKDDGDFPPLTG